MEDRPLPASAMSREVRIKNFKGPFPQAELRVRDMKKFEVGFVADIAFDAVSMMLKLDFPYYGSPAPGRTVCVKCNDPYRDYEITFTEQLYYVLLDIED